MSDRYDTGDTWGPFLALALVVALVVSSIIWNVVAAFLGVAIAALLYERMRTNLARNEYGRRFYGKD